MTEPVAFMATLANGDRWLSFEPIPVSDLRAQPAEVRGLVLQATLEYWMRLAGDRQEQIEKLELQNRRLLERLRTHERP